MRTLLIDNYDSCTYNLYQLLAQVNGTEPVVLRNDDPSLDSLGLDDFDGAVISPGPGHPASERDFGHSRTVLDGLTYPSSGSASATRASAWSPAGTCSARRNPGAATQAWPPHQGRAHRRGGVRRTSPGVHRRALPLAMRRRTAPR